MFKSRSSEISVPVVYDDEIVDINYYTGRPERQLFSRSHVALVARKNRTWDQIYDRKSYSAARASGTLQTSSATTQYFKQGVATGRLDFGAPMTKLLNSGRVVEGKYSSATTWPIWLAPAVHSWSAARDVNALNIAKIQALLKAADARSMLLVDLAEAQKTQDMIAARVKQLATALSSVKNLQFGKAGSILGMRPRDVKRAVRRAAKRTPKRLADATSVWLELRYGWMPLVYSVQDAAAHLATLVHKPYIEHRVLRSHSSYDETRTSRNPWSLTTVDGRELTLTQNRVEETTNTVKVWVKVAPISYELHQLNAGGFVNLAEVAWELVPLSFVVDWFIPIGDWIASLSSLVGLSVTDAGYSVARSTTTRVSYDSFSLQPLQGGGFTVSGFDEGSSITYSYQRYTRAQMDESSGGVYPSFPPVKVKLNSKRFLDAYSLLVQAGNQRLRG